MNNAISRLTITDNFHKVLQIFKIPAHIAIIAESLANYYGDNSQELKLLLLLIAIKTKTGNFCLIIPTEKNTFLNEVCLTIEDVTFIKQPNTLISKYFIEVFRLRKQIIKNNQQIFGYNDDYKPVIISNNSFYFLRWFIYEKDINYFFQQRIHTSLKNKWPESIENILQLTITHAKQASLFQLTSTQIDAIKLSLKNNLTVITGGPGTGKTTIIINILRALLYANNHNSLSIFLTAPTGKAASKLMQSILTATDNSDSKTLSAKQKLIDSKLPKSSYTLHRLLHQKLKRRTYYSEREEKLDADVLIIDEASMIPIDIFVNITKAISNHCRIILIGDKNQLPAVNSISIFNNFISNKDIYTDKSEEIIIKLTEAKRANKDITELTTAIENSDIQWFKNFLNTCSNNNNYSNYITFKNSQDHTINNILQNILNKNIKISYYEIDFFNKPQDEQNQFLNEIFTVFNSFKILCITNEGKYGVETINTLCKKLSKKGSDKYHMHPIMITENDYQNSLLNGEQGIILRIKGEGLKAFFATEKGYRSIALFKLKSYNFSYAMTIHKSQGSEYQQILLVLPDEEIRIMTKQLIYTGITRAKENIIIYGKEQIFLSTII